MKRYIGYLTTALAALLAGCFFKFALSGYGTLAWASFLIALAALWFLGLRLLDPLRPRLARFLNKLTVYVILVGLFILGVTVTMIASDAAPRENGGADYAVVLGAGVNGTVPSRSLRARLEAALEYAEENPDTVFILSGGQGRGEEITEAACMARWLAARGVSPDRLLEEPRASTTRENIAFSRELILAREPDFDGRVCIVTEVYHVTRAKYYAEKGGFAHVTAAAGYTGLPVLTANYYLREAVALWATLLKLA